ncbi:hypothetical protein PR202_gb10340 [Eleusine coracana subsp. coracana]|uniref:Late embryogenesis abundant protein LEA-2 subgroup domain-containing protein n=1 Tax=Eleusine coracana subsp. coracana TaxID=191504 RepID=A0AAV5EJ99_ELECO|nr:hypothetical protein QOZ80_3BG0254380 [Eleusine coracana subsp. coracana]GJN22745.1 hypothetical protein PR202_gb10340 [Eleusine coracana subsp. coracana]
MCDECCGCFGTYRRFALGFCIGVSILAAIAVIVVLLLGYGGARRLRADVDDASLARFEVAAATSSPATTVSYNLTLVITVRNPNWAMGATLRSLEADYLFDGQRFDRVAAVPRSSSSSQGYDLPARKATVFRLVSGDVGAFAPALGRAGVKEYRREKREGVFDIEVGLSGEVRYHLHRTWCRLEAKCPLKLQLATSDAGAVVFRRTTCDVLRSLQRGC